VATAQPQTQNAREVATEYFDALAAQDLDRAVATWKPGSIDRLHGVADLVAPDGIRNYFASLFAAVPDFRFEVLDMVAEGDQVAVRWRTGGSFSGTGDVLGFAPNGRPIELEGLDLLTIEDGRIVSNFAYVNGMVFAQQIGALPDPDSRQGRAMAAAFNAKTAIAKRLRRG
jgi:predicted ester cyclase